MARNKGAQRQKTGAELREERLKAALKANMARRKAQAKARTGPNNEKTQGQ
ncbi:hypothetical protein [Pseudorhodobacter sp. E13]|uniref:hypothetical protein n=1 Tax=Pseudorhodobacter sp. E13 TaxID=2487931 RepID=UPI0018F738A6|nr:hypothetical protein [Pseudorhodobacter sp. E13]